MADVVIYQYSPLGMDWIDSILQTSWECGVGIPALIVTKEQFEDMLEMKVLRKIKTRYFYENDFGSIQIRLG